MKGERKIPIQFAKITIKVFFALLFPDIGERIGCSDIFMSCFKFLPKNIIDQLNSSFSINIYRQTWNIEPKLEHPQSWIKLAHNCLF